MSNVHDLHVSLCVPDVGAALAFYQQAFGATELFRLTDPGGRVGHLEIRLGQHLVMMSEPFPELGIEPPKAEQRPPVAMHLKVDNADATVDAAVAAGATVVYEVKDQFYGERAGRVRDPFGYEWAPAHTVEELSVEEMQSRFTAMCGGGDV